MVRRIVVPLDGSPVAERALPWAVALAKRWDASLLLVAVIDIPVELGVWSATRGAVIDQELNVAKSRSESYLRSIADGLGVPAEVVVKIGGAASEILAVADELPERMIVMSSHGRTGLSRILLGSVASRIIQGAKCPVMIIRHREGTPLVSDVKLESILVPLDGSAFAEDALARATKFDGSLRIHLIRVVEPPALPPASAFEPGLAYDVTLYLEFVEAMREEAVAYLEEQRKALEAQGYTVTAEVCEGRVADEILRVATERAVDFIAMATHGRSGLSRVVFGSVAERVLSGATVPVLVVRPST